jgi:hypothetical protein
LGLIYGQEAVSLPRRRAKTLGESLRAAAASSSKRKRTVKRRPEPMTMQRSRPGGFGA